MAVWNIEDDVTDKFYQALKKLCPLYTNTFRERKGMPHNLFYEINMSLVPKSDSSKMRTNFTGQYIS